VTDKTRAQKGPSGNNLNGAIPSNPKMDDHDIDGRPQRVESGVDKAINSPVVIQTVKHKQPKLSLIPSQKKGASQKLSLFSPKEGVS
jgi:hypothetical protein